MNTGIAEASVWACCEQRSMRLGPVLDGQRAGRVALAAVLVLAAVLEAVRAMVMVAEVLAAVMAVLGATAVALAVVLAAVVAAAFARRRWRSLCWVGSGRRRRGGSRTWLGDSVDGLRLHDDALDVICFDPRCRNWKDRMNWSGAASLPWECSFLLQSLCVPAGRNESSAPFSDFWDS